MPTTRKNGFPLGFVFDCETPRNPSCAHLRISKISNDVTKTSFADQTTECLLLGCDASILANYGINTLKHFRTNSCDRTAWARQIMELWFSCCRSYHSFYREINRASVDCSTSINTAKMFVDVSHQLFLSNKEFYHNTCLYSTSLTDSITRRSRSDTVRNLYNFIYKCQKLQICFI